MKEQIKRSSKSKVPGNAKMLEIAQAKAGVKKAVIIRPGDVETAGWVKLKCQFGCAGYGQCLVCPPYTPDSDRMRQVLDEYKRGILIHFAPDANVKAVIVELEREIFLLGAWKAFGLGAGPCNLCNECVLTAGGCRNPEQARPAMEACGIDVFSTAHKAGFDISVVRTSHDCPNYFGLLLVD